MTKGPPTDRVELAVRHTIGSIMSGRADVDRVIERLIEQNFQPAEINAILREASRRMSAFGKAADREFYQHLMKLGAVSLLIAIGLVANFGYPQHGRGVGILFTGVVFGLGALGYGAFGKMFRG